MANLREIKKDIDFLISEVVFDSTLTVYYHTEKKEEVMGIIQEAVDLRNNLFEMVNNPAEKHNKSLVKKHYRFIREELLSKVDLLFGKLSAINKK